MIKCTFKSFSVKRKVFPLLKYTHFGELNPAVVALGHSVLKNSFEIIDIC